MKKNNKTFAEIAEALNRKEQKYTKMLESASTNRARNSANLMLDRVAERKQALMDENKMMAGEPEAMVPEMAVGGPVPTAFTAGVYDPSGFLNAGRIPETQMALPQLPGLDPTQFMQAPENIKATLKAGTPKASFMDKLKTIGSQAPDAIMDTASTVAPFMDNFAFSKYMNSVKSNPTPDLYSAPAMDTTVDVNPELAQAAQGQRTLNRSLDRSNTSRGVANNNKIAGFSKRMGNTGRVLAGKRNQEAQLKNRASMISNNVNNKNTDVVNRLRQSNTDFLNEKAYNKYLNTLNVSEDIGEINTQRLNRRAQEQSLDVLKPLYNRFGLLEKYFPQFNG